MLNINNIRSYWKHAQCQNKLWLLFKSLYSFGFCFLDLKHRLMYSCSMPNNVTVYKLYTFHNFHTKINMNLVKVSYFFQLHDRDM